VTFGALAAAAASAAASNDVEPGVLGFLIVAGIGDVLVFLLRSVNKLFRKIEALPLETGAEDESAKATAQTPE
jgi:hypothetical protein